MAWLIMKKLLDENDDYYKFKEALYYVSEYLAKCDCW